MYSNVLWKYELWTQSGNDKIWHLKFCSISLSVKLYQFAPRTRPRLWFRNQLHGYNTHIFMILRHSRFSPVPVANYFKGYITIFVIVAKWTPGRHVVTRKMIFCACKRNSFDRKANPRSRSSKSQTSENHSRKETVECKTRMWALWVPLYTFFDKWY